jgi:hypothetical protein
MNASLIKVERESRKWRAKFEETNKMLIGLVAQKKDADDLVAQRDRQLENLQKLCRTLQEERSGMLKQLKQLPTEDAGAVVTEALPTEPVDNANIS